MTIFKPKPWVNPFGKMSIFRLLELLVFIAQKGVFLILKYRKRHFPGLYGLRKKHLEKWPFLDQIQGLTPLEKCQFYDFLNFLFFTASKRVFSLQNIVKDIFLPFITKKKSWKNGHFCTKTIGKMSILRLLNFLFLQPRKTTFRSRIS